MKPAKFDYHVARSVDEAVEILGSLMETSDVKLLAGGQSLVPLMNMRLARPDHLIDLGRIPELQRLSVDASSLTVGSMVTHRAVELSSAVNKANPLLASGIRHIAHFQIRERGTVGGSIAHADPAAELPLLAVMLDAEIEVQGPREAHTVAARSFFLSYLTTVLWEDEVVTSVCFRALAPDEGWGFGEFSRRRGDFALVAAAATVSMVDGTCGSVRLGFAGVADVPRLFEEATDIAVGEEPSRALWEELANRAAESADPTADAHAGKEDRRDLMRYLGLQVLEAAAIRALNPDQRVGRSGIDADPLQLP